MLGVGGWLAYRVWSPPRRELLVSDEWHGVGLRRLRAT